MGPYTIGSSPRVWGRRVAHHVGLVDLRFIPTRVGRTVLPAPQGALNGRFIPTRVGRMLRWRR